jgi:hypothetical protein
MECSWSKDEFHDLQRRTTVNVLNKQLRADEDDRALKVKANN